MKKLDEMEKKRQAARRMVTALNSPAQTGQHWIMSIPAEPTDPDVVIGDALLDMARCLDWMRRAEAFLLESLSNLEYYNVDGSLDSRVDGIKQLLKELEE